MLLWYAEQEMLPFLRAAAVCGAGHAAFYMLLWHVEQDMLGFLQAAAGLFYMLLWYVEQVVLLFYVLLRCIEQGRAAFLHARSVL